MKVLPPVSISQTYQRPSFSGFSTDQFHTGISKAGTKVFLYIVFQCSSNVTNFILKEKNVANKYFFLLEILEKKEERRIYLITFNAYYTIVIKNIFLLQEEIHRTKENRNAQKQIYLCSVM